MIYKMRIINILYNIYIVNYIKKIIMRQSAKYLITYIITDNKIIDICMFIIDGYFLI